MSTSNCATAEVALLRIADALTVAIERTQDARTEYRLRLALDLVLAVAGVAPTGSLAYHADNHTGVVPTHTGGAE